MAIGRLLDVVWNINGYGGATGNYDGYMYDFLVCNYLPSKLPMSKSDVGRDYKELKESQPLRRRRKVFTAPPARMAIQKQVLRL